MAEPAILTSPTSERVFRFGSQRGESRFGCIVSALLILVFVFVCYKVFPVYLDKVDFEDNLARLASRAGVENWDVETVEKRVLALARTKDFESTRDDVEVQRPLRFQPVPEIKITVRYRRTVEFPGYTYVFHFESRVSSFVGRL